MTTANLVTSDLSVTEAFEKYSFVLNGNQQLFPLSSTIAVPDEFTLSCWVRNDGYQSTGSMQYGYIAGVDTNAGFAISQGGTGSGLSTGQLYWWDGVGAAGEILTTTILTADTWYHLAFVCDKTVGSNGEIKLYINGNLDTTTALTLDLNNWSNFTMFGANVDPTGWNWGGYFSSFSLWNSTLSAANITTLYNGGKPGDLSSFSPTPTHWWRLGENAFWTGVGTYGPWYIWDEIGTTYLDSAIMTENSLQGNAPLTYANGTSVNMGGDEIIGEAANSTSNSISTNMSVIARVTDTPA